MSIALPCSVFYGTLENYKGFTINQKTFNQTDTCDTHYGVRPPPVLIDIGDIKITRVLEQINLNLFVNDGTNRQTVSQTH